MKAVSKKALRLSSMHLIFLHGKPNVGKSTTLNGLYFELLSLGAKVVVWPSDAIGTPNDFECILEYKEKKIAISSVGDNHFPITYAIGYYDAKECDVLVLAYSKKVVTKNNKKCPSYLEYILKRFSHFQMIEKTSGGNTVQKQDPSDVKALKKLLCVIDEICQ